MIVNFNEDYLRDLYRSGKSDKKHRFQPQIVRKYIRVIDLMISEDNVQGLWKYNSLNYERLEGNKEGLSSVRVNDQYRIEFEEEFDMQELKQNLCREEMIVLLDDPKKEIYPLQTFVYGKDEFFVGRIRRDYSVKSGINMWCVADNIRKGAATNAVQILEKLIGKRLGK